MSGLKTISYRSPRSFAKKLPGARSIVTLLLSIGSLALTAQTPASREYQLKAAFLFTFTQFVEWPKRAFTTNEAPLIIGILGENPFGTYLEEIVYGEKVNGRPVIVSYYKNIEEIKTCHILFINPVEAKKMEQVIAGLAARTILTVSDDPYFPKSGGMVRLFTRENKIKIQINLEASIAANLVISSKLLRLAEIFIPKENN